MRLARPIIGLLAMIQLLACAQGSQDTLDSDPARASIFAKSGERFQIDQNSPVRLSLTTAPRSYGGFALTSLHVQNVQYEIDQCVSGFYKPFSAGQIDALALYRYDRDCRLRITQVEVNNHIYKPAGNAEFIDKLGAINTFVNPSGDKVYILPVKTLPAILSEDSYQLEYLLTTQSKGRTVSLEVQEVAIFADTTQIMEDSTDPVLVTILRSPEAEQAMDIVLESTGSAQAGVDFKGLPATLSFAPGVHELNFSLTVIDDELIEGNEEIRIRLGSGNYVPAEEHGEIVIELLDDDIPMGRLELVGQGNLGLRPQHQKMAQELVLSNSGNLPISLQPMSWQNGVFHFLGGSYPGRNGNCGTSLAVGASCSIMVSTSTTNLGVKRDILLTEYNDGLQLRYFKQPIEVEIVETAILVVAASHVDFGSHGIGSTVSKQITLSNIGNYPASQIRLGQELALPFYFPQLFPGEGSNCTATLAAGASCQLVMSFTPSSSGIFSDNVVISYDDGTGNQQNSVFGVHGEGGSLGFLQISNAPVYDFGSAQVGDYRIHHFVLRNPGHFPVEDIVANLSGPGFRYANSNLYPGLGASCGHSLGAGKECSIAIAFSPPSEGSFTGQLNITYHNQVNQAKLQLVMTGTGSSIIAVEESYITALNRPLAIQLKTKNGLAPFQYQVIAPDHGTLSGTAPNLIYVPDTNFSGRDYLSFRVTARNGQSQLALIRIFVAPQALFVAASTKLDKLEQQAFDMIQNMGFQLTIRAQSQLSSVDAIGKDLIVLSQSADSALVGQIFRQVQIPVIAWDNTLYPHLGMTAANTPSGLFRSDTLRIIDATHRIAQGFALGNYKVFNHHNYYMPYIILDHINLQKIGVLPNATDRAVLFAYEAQAQMAGGLIAPARRVGSFLSGSGPVHGLSPAGEQLVDNSIHWAMSGSDSLLVDHFQRPDNQSLSQSWQEFESAAAQLRIESGRLAFAASSEPVYARRGFERQLKSTVSVQFLINLARRAGTLGTAHSADQSCEESPWERDKIYIEGRRVYHNGKIWRAKWWTQGEEPGTTGQWGVWEEVGSCAGGPIITPDPGCGASLWSPVEIYNTGDKVAYNGIIWRAKWWTQNQEPGTTGEWGVWENLGPCTEDVENDTNYWFRLQIGQCDLMNTEDPDAGVAAQLIWGGPEAGLADHESLGYLSSGQVETISEMNQNYAKIRLILNLDSQTFRVETPEFSSDAIPFERSVHIDCVRIAAKNINANNSTGHQIDNLRIVASE